MSPEINAPALSDEGTRAHFLIAYIYLFTNTAAFPSVYCKNRRRDPKARAWDPKALQAAVSLESCLGTACPSPPLLTHHLPFSIPGLARNYRETHREPSGGSVPAFDAVFLRLLLLRNYNVSTVARLLLHVARLKEKRRAATASVASVHGWPL